MENMMPYVWILVIVVMSVAEACTVQLISIWFVVGAIAALIFSIFSDSVVLQVIVFASVTALTLILTRPFLKKFLDFKKEDMNLGKYIGKTGVVIKQIDNLQEVGQVNVLGSVWTARSVDGSVIDEGESVVVDSIQGVKLLVKKL